jgi:hypothetical protein
MDYFVNRAVVDLNPLFKEIFESRDGTLGRPEYDRSKRLDRWRMQYAFTPVEFVEGVFANYSPQQMGAFLRRNIPKDDIQSESFLKRIEGFESTHRMALLGAYGDYKRYYFRTLGFPPQELREILIATVPHTLHSKVKHGWGRFRGKLFTGKDKENSVGLAIKAGMWGYDAQHKIIKRIREALLEQKVPIVLLNQYGPVCELDDISLLRQYNVDITKLRVIKEK